MPKFARFFFVVTCVCQAASCASTVPSTITRTVGGERRTGAFVPPYSYEWYVRAELAVSAGDYDQAIEAFRMALTGPEEDAYILARLGSTLYLAGSREQAMRTLQRGLALDPQSEAVWLTMAEIAEKEKRFDDAIKAYARAVAASPISEQAPLALARLLRSRGADTRADRVLTVFISQVGSGSPQAARARLRLAIARGDAEAAALAAEALLEIAPGHHDEVRNAAKAAFQKGDPWMASVLLKRLERKPEDDAMIVNAMIKTGQKAQARAVLFRASPERFGGEIETAKLYLAADDPQTAAEIASVYASKSSTAQWLWGKALLEQGKALQAVEILRQVPFGVKSFASARLDLADAFAELGLVSISSEILEATQHTPMGYDDAVGCKLASRRRSYDPAGALEALADLNSNDAQIEKLKVLEQNEPERATAHVLEHSHQLRSALPQLVAAETAWSEGNNDRAIQLLASYNDETPTDLWARIRRIEMLVRTGRAALADRLSRQLYPLLTNASLRQWLERLIPMLPLGTEAAQE